MNLVTIIENVEIERTNNKNLGDAVVQRMTTELEWENTEIIQLEALLNVKRENRDKKQRAIEAARKEFGDRDEALAALIGGE